MGRETRRAYRYRPDEKNSGPEGGGLSRPLGKGEAVSRSGGHSGTSPTDRCLSTTRASKIAPIHKAFHGLVTTLSFNFAIQSCTGVVEGAPKRHSRIGLEANARVCDSRACTEYA